MNKTKERIIIKGYKKIDTQKKYIVKKYRNSNKTMKTMIINALKEILKIFTIFNMANIMQFFVVNDEYVINIFKPDFIRNTSVGTYFNAVRGAFNEVYWLSLGVLILFYVIIYSVTNRKKISYFFVIGMLYIFSIINYIVTSVRGSAITISDFLQARTAINVSKGISFELNKNVKIATIITLCTIFLIIWFYKKNDKISIKKRVLGLCSGITGLLIISTSGFIQDINIWNMNYVYSDYGVVLATVRLINNYKIKEPKDYNKKNVEEILAKNEDLNVEENDDNINIVVIMNESFADYFKIENVELIEDNIPFFHSLQNEENVITGIMHSDAFGGRTANIEYEFLTQNTVAFLPAGAVVYQQYINKNHDSIVRKMNNLNYITYGMHLWNKSGYRRSPVYKFLEFNEYRFREDFDDLEYLQNEYTKDISCYKKIIEIFENKEKEEKIFSFNVTVQNHQPFNFHNNSEKDYINGYETMNNYLQIQHESDVALEYLINYLKKYNEKVIVLFFGDHQPKTDMESIVMDEENKYKVPYLIWANYTIEKVQYGDTSANYLQSILIETAKLPKDEYTNYIIKLRNKIPVLTANYYIAEDGKKYLIEDKTSPYYKYIEEYRNIVYYKIFNK